jgi:hypothetical protein
MKKMETKQVERLWQATMNVVVAMKKEGLDTGDAAESLRNSKVLINHCKYDEHAHGEELFEAELEIEGIQGQLISILEEAGRADDFSFDLPTWIEKNRVEHSNAPPVKVAKNKTWVRIKVSEEMDVEKISNVEGVKVVEKDGEFLTLSGDNDSIQKAIKEISKVFSG